MRSRFITLVTLPALIALIAAADVNVLTERVLPIRTVQETQTTARLVVYVVDDLGQAVKDATVAVHSTRGSREVARALSGADGTARIEVHDDSEVVVRASMQGFVPSEARNVSIRRGHLAAVALPLEVAPIRSWISQ